VSPETDPLARAVAPQRPRTAPMPRLAALCGRPTPAGQPCHLRSKHGAGCLPPPAGIVRPHQWGTR
jgi:hypothetical protein